MGALSIASPIGQITEDEFAALTLEAAKAAASAIARAMEVSGALSASV
jgi:hypothetical protein